MQDKIVVAAQMNQNESKSSVAILSKRVSGQRDYLNNMWMALQRLEFVTYMLQYSTRINTQYPRKMRAIFISNKK